MKKLFLILFAIPSLVFAQHDLRKADWWLDSNSPNAAKQAALDAMVPMFDLIHSVQQTTDGQCGVFEDGAYLNLCESGDEIKGLKSGGSNKPSTHNLPYAGNTGLTPSNAHVWSKDFTTTNIGPRYIETSDKWSGFCEMINGPPLVSYFETASSFAVKTYPIEIWLCLRYQPQTQDEGTHGIKMINDPATQHLALIDDYTPAQHLANGTHYPFYKISLTRVVIRADQTWQVWTNGVSIGSGTGQSHSTTEWIWGTSSHVLGSHVYWCGVKWGLFTDPQAIAIYNFSNTIWPVNTDPTFPYIKEIFYGDASCFNDPENRWEPGRGKVEAFVGGNGIEGNSTYSWYHFDLSNPTRFPSPDQVLSNHEQIPGYFNVTGMGTGDIVTQLSVDGFNLMSTPVAYTTSVTVTADLIVSNIDGAQTKYDAERTSAGTILLYPIGLGCNIWSPGVITNSVSGFVPTVVNFQRGRYLDRDDLVIDGHIFDGKAGNGAIKVARVTCPEDNTGKKGPCQCGAWAVDNIN